jgi:hypothetical protein
MNVMTASQTKADVAGNRARKLRDDVGNQLRGLESPPDCQSDRYGRIEVTARDMPDCVRHRQNRQSEGKRDAQQPDSHTGKCGSQDSATATTQNQPESTDEFRGKTIGHWHLFPLHLLVRRNCNCPFDNV